MILGIWDDTCVCVCVCVQIATRKAYGMALAKLGRYNERVVALDGDTKNSTFSEIFKNEHPNRYVECYIAEQNMVRRRLWKVLCPSLSVPLFSVTSWC